MKKKIYQLDAFTNTPFTGNPAGVVPDASGLSDHQMQQIAKEMNLSETAFVLPGGQGYDVEVRFFTPYEEVDLCGHATIATFSLLRHLNRFPIGQSSVIQKTKAGNLEIKFQEDTIVMRQADPIQISNDFSLDLLTDVMMMNLEHLGIELDTSKTTCMPEIWSTGLKDLIIPVSSVEVLQNLKPDMNKLAKFSIENNLIGVHAFAFDDNNEIWCRNFAPACGIPEESATGTSNGALGAYLFHKGYRDQHQLKFIAKQGDWMNSPSRINVEVVKNDTIEVWVGGSAVIVIDGEINLS